MNILSLHDYALEAVLEKLSYSEIAKLRQVCKRFNYLCKILLNRGCKMMLIKSYEQKFICEAPPIIKSNHMTLIRLLDLLYLKYIEFGYSECKNSYIFCFIPGKVLDEFYRIKKFLIPENPTFEEYLYLNGYIYQIDCLLNLAMKHFKGQIIPMIKRKKRIRALKKFFTCQRSERDSLLPHPTLESHPYVAWKRSSKLF